MMRDKKNLAWLAGNKKKNKKYINTKRKEKKKKNLYKIRFLYK